jgi:hypothetical protein
MNSSKKKLLEADGWKVGSAAKFLNFSSEEGLEKKIFKK